VTEYFPIAAGGQWARLIFSNAAPMPTDGVVESAADTARRLAGCLKRLVPAAVYAELCRLLVSEQELANVVRAEYRSAGVDRPTLGQLVRTARVAAGLSQVSLARQLGLSGSYVCHVEADRRVPSDPIVARFAAELGLNVEVLLGALGIVATPSGRNLPTNGTRSYDLGPPTPRE
jgi:DNA-binding XRE family transcriptional regulator